MRRALLLARRGWGRTAPNPLVGAVVVRDGKVVGEGWHAEFGGPHAEVVALEAAGSAARGADLFVTLEPCSHQGKTPPCTLAIIDAGVARVITATRDPTPLAGGGNERLRAAGIAVTEGVERAAAEELVAPFLFTHRDATRPFVTLKLAVSTDGAIAAVGGDPKWITGKRSRLEVHRLRAGADALMVGIGTAVADDPQLTVRMGRRPRVRPVRVVFDPAARLPLTSKLVRTAKRTPTWVLSRLRAPGAGPLVAAGVHVIEASDLAAGLKRLRSEGIRHLLVEGGAGLAATCIAAGLVDRLIIFRAPVLLGAGALPAFGGATPDEVTARWRVVERRSLGDDVMTIYAPPGR